MTPTVLLFFQQGDISAREIESGGSPRGEHGESHACSFGRLRVGGGQFALQGDTDELSQRGPPLDGRDLGTA